MSEPSWYMQFVQNAAQLDADEPSSLAIMLATQMLAAEAAKQYPNWTEPALDGQNSILSVALDDPKLTVILISCLARVAITALQEGHADEVDDQAKAWCQLYLERLKGTLG